MKIQSLLIVIPPDPCVLYVGFFNLIFFNFYDIIYITKEELI